jgi:hypothetical protein
LRKIDMIAGTGTSADFAAFHKAQGERWGAVIKTAGIKAE